MPLSRLPYRNTGYFSPLICDLLDQHPALGEMIAQPISLKAFETQVQEKQTQFPHEHRKIVVESLRQQYKSTALSPSVKKNIALLEKPTTFTVTTGHQLNLLTGPLYFVYKIITTINLAQQLKKAQPDFDFIPIFWMATEDHDFEEISFFNFNNQKVKWVCESHSAVGRLPLESLKPVLDLFEQKLGQSQAAQQLKLWIQNSYRSSSTLSEATRKLVHELFSKNGLIILDADRSELKRLFVPYVKNELEQESCFKAVNQTVEQIQSNYSKAYKPQVNPREINLFHLTDSLRQRIVKADNGFVLRETKQAFSMEEILSEVEQYPERFSPNVLMRPLYQEVLLPNLCYIGGGGELAYWLELKQFFKTQNILFPLLLLRNSAVLVSSKIKQKITRLEVDKKDLFLTRKALTDKKVVQISAIDLSLHPLKKQLTEQFNFLENLVLQTDASFEGAVKAQKQKQFKGIDRLEKRLLKAQSRKLNNQVERLTLVQESIFPNNSLQERYANFFEFYLEYGEDLLPQIMESLEPLQLEFSWIELS